MKGQPLTLTVEELNEYVRRSLAGDPMLHGLRLRGEISNFKRHVSGHWYFTLKDEQSAIACAMFRSVASGIGFTPRDGQQVVLAGSVGLYVKTGSYQFYADNMEPDGVGELYLRMETLKQRLSQEGLFDPALKKPLPLLPKGIGIATSGTGAVIHDIARIAWRRDAGMPLYLYPVAVQGEGAAEQIAAALNVLDKLDSVDVIIVGRGGGSMEDLWPFNEEKVARAMAACHKPVISAVGHETDFTIADFIADVRAATPSVAAELAVPRREALQAEVDALFQRLRRAAQAGLSSQDAKLSSLKRRLAEQTPDRQLSTLGERVKAMGARLSFLCEAALNHKEHLVGEASLRIKSSSPEATLQRGYVLVKQQGQMVLGVNQLQPLQPFSITFRDGTVEAQILHIHGEE